MACKSSKHILIVDDHDIIRTTVRESLDKTGYTCKTASDCFEALIILEEHHFDLVISDIVMPGMDGIQFMEKATSSFPHLDFIIMTGYASDYTYVDILDAGAADYIVKPFGMNELKARVRRIERKNRVLKELGEAGEIELSLDIEKEEDERIKFHATVRDTGIGIPKPKLDSISLLPFGRPMAPQPDSTEALVWGYRYVSKYQSL